MDMTQMLESLLAKMDTDKEQMLAKYRRPPGKNESQ
jgi:hypothetical protein